MSLNQREEAVDLQVLGSEQARLLYLSPIRATLLKVSNMQAIHSIYIYYVYIYTVYTYTANKYTCRLTGLQV